jgi:hypothetical protein
MPDSFINGRRSIASRLSSIGTAASARPSSRLLIAHLDNHPTLLAADFVVAS